MRYIVLENEHGHTAALKEESIQNVWDLGKHRVVNFMQGDESMRLITSVSFDDIMYLLEPPIFMERSPI
jgi:hypothetical protein